MPATELSLLRLIPPQTATSPSLLSHLRQAKLAMEEYSGGYLFDFFHCIEDPSHIFIIGGWPSVKFHMEDWLPSKQNQELLEVIKKDVDVEWMFHTSLDDRQRELLVKMVGEGGVRTPTIGRHVLKKGEKEGFEKCFGEVKRYLEAYIGGEEKVIGGWRIDRGYVKGDEERSEEEEMSDEWVLFTGWDSKEKHLEFAQAEVFKEYARIRDFVEVFDIKHTNRLEV